MEIVEHKEHGAGRLVCYTGTYRDGRARVLRCLVEFESGVILEVENREIGIDIPSGRNRPRDGILFFEAYWPMSDSMLNALLLLVWAGPVQKSGHWLSVSMTALVKRRYASIDNGIVSIRHEYLNWLSLKGDE